jgi:hypothetical protein
MKRSRILIVAALLLVSSCVTSRAEPDPYAACGARRYTAQAFNQNCERPWYCGVLARLPRNCTSARFVKRLWGNSAERRARACGATDAEIEEARKC